MFTVEMFLCALIVSATVVRSHDSRRVRYRSFIERRPHPASAHPPTFRSQNVTARNSTEDTSYRIIGGVGAHIESFPYQLQLTGRVLDTDGNEMGEMCGATLIAPSVAVTAAHCFNREGKFHVRAGSTTYGRGGVRMEIASVTVHPQYDPKAHHSHDIALVRLVDDLPLGPQIRPAALPPPGAAPPPGFRGNVTGWGVVDTATDKTADMLQVVEVPVVDWDDCKQLTGYVQETKFCAGYREGGRDSCQGDSGGSFASDGVLYGLVSAGTSRGCAQFDELGTYTNVAMFRDFIKEVGGV